MLVERPLTVQYATTHTACQTLDSSAVTSDRYHRLDDPMFYDPSAVRRFISMIGRGVADAYVCQLVQLSRMITLTRCVRRPEQPKKGLIGAIDKRTANNAIMSVKAPEA